VAIALRVKRDARSRGGSQFMHEALRVGTPLTVSAPRNNFRCAKTHGTARSSRAGSHNADRQHDRTASCARAVVGTRICRPVAPRCGVSRSPHAVAAGRTCTSTTKWAARSASVRTCRTFRERRRLLLRTGADARCVSRGNCRARPDARPRRALRGRTAGTAAWYVVVELARSKMSVTVADGESILAALRNAGNLGGVFVRRRRLRYVRDRGTRWTSRSSRQRVERN